ncbi:dienelactone hydrolase family protein [Nocardia alni]|uniref:dienelactone hydrolase family protein n=1 Tax=Nocardia alni TaxID=2815723 RepID=UPI001C2271B9|nr:dienelactone hydrolase family protein [Nocardia alni]
MTIVSRDVIYADLDTPLTGFLCRDDEQPGERPGILLIHGGAGLDEHAKDQARRYASLGYSVFACDMLGDAAGDRERIVTALTAFRNDPASLRRRARAAMAALRESPGTDGRMAAVGFCFGGLAALTLARAGEALAGVISIHGSLTNTAPAEPRTIRARILVCHGAADPHVPAADVTSFTEEMNTAAADWQLNMYGGVQHGFTHKNTPSTTPGVAYDLAADTRSFAAASAFLTEIFA